MDKRKKKLAKRGKKRIKARTDIITKLTTELNRLAKDKTPPEIVDSQVDFYSKCNNTEQEILMAIFRRNEEIRKKERKKTFRRIRYIFKRTKTI